LSLLYELAFGGGLKWWRPSWKGLSFSVPNVPTQKPAQPKEMNTFLCHAVPEVVPFLSRAPVLLVRKYPYWKLQGFSVVDSSIRTSIKLMHTGIHSLLE
jgi:hypothetical protein